MLKKSTRDVTRVVMAIPTMKNIQYSESPDPTPASSKISMNSSQPSPASEFREGEDLDKLKGGKSRPSGLMIFSISKMAPCRFSGQPFPQDLNQSIIQ
jgi:hypothetical protein